MLTTGFLIWLYTKRNDNFYFVRNMFMVAMGLALVGYSLFPTAPPRMLSNAGFTDTVSAISHTDEDSTIAGVFVNPYAAVPSMHIAFSLMIGVPGVLLCRSLGARLWWSAYPMFVFFVIVVTANHFWFDAACGAAVACMAAVAAKPARASAPQLGLARGGDRRGPRISQSPVIVFFDQLLARDRLVLEVRCRRSSTTA